MRWYNKLKLVFRIYSRRIFVTLMVFAMCMVSFYVVDKVLTDYISSRYELWQADNQLGCDPENGFYVQLYSGSNTAENLELIKDFLRKHKYVKETGCAMHRGLDVKQLGNEELVDPSEEFQNCGLILCDKDVMALGNLKLSDEQMELINSADENCEPVFLGSDYKGKVEIGTKVTIEYGRKVSDVYIAGFLEKDAAWPHDQGLFHGSFGETDDYNLNAGSVLVTDDVTDYYSVDLTYFIVYGIAMDGCFEQLKVDISRYAIQNGLNLKIVNYGEQIQEKKEKDNILGDDTLIAAIMLTVLAIVSVATSTIIYCLVNKEHYGIMIANGLSKGGIVWIITMQNAITIIVAGVAAWFIRNNELFGNNTEGMSKAELISFNEVTYRQLYVAHDIYMPFILFAVGLIILLSASIIPAYIIRKTPLTDMLSHRN